MEQLFSVQAKFFFARITSWFAVTVPLLFELPLQVRALMVFLAYNEECFLHAFFETGVVEPLMRTLSVICDAPDEVRSFAIAMLHKLALGGKRQKQLLCERGLPGATAECIISGGLRWGAVRAAGRMLLELFRGNPLHQENVLQTLLVLLGQRAPLAQRVSAETLATLFASEREVSSRLTDPSVHATVVELALQLLQSDDLHASADAYRLLVCMVQSFGCDELLRDFARSQLQDERNLAEEWMRLEADIQRATTPKHRHRGATLWLHRAVAKAVVGEPAEGLEDLTREDVLAELDDDFRTEAAHVFRWGLVMCLVRRDEVFCDELVQDGLAETLLVCLLNTTQPVCQAVALVEVHRLRLISRHTEWLTEQVLSFEMMRAVTLEQFMAASSPESLARSRCRLRNIRQEARGARHSAQEIALRQHLVEHAMMDVMKSTSSGAADGGDSGGVFLTATAVGGRDEGAGAGEAMGANAATDDHLGDGAGATASDDAEVPRSGSGIFSVQRVPPASAGGAGSAGLGASLLAGPGGGDGAGGYQVMLGPADEIPFMGSLVSMLIDLADGDGLGVHVDASGNFSGSGMNLVGRSSVLIRGGVAGASGTSLPSDTRSNCGRELAASGSFLRLDGMQQRHNQHGNSSSRGDHRPTAQHLRALALRPLAPRGVESHPPALLRRRGPPVAASALLPPLAPSRADSDATELSLRIVDELHSKASAHHDHHDHCHGCPSHMVSVDEASLLEDSVTTDLKPNFSQRYLSSIADTSLGPEQQSWSTSQDPLAGGPSWLSAGTSDHLPDDSTYWNFADEMNDYHMVKMHKGSTVALLDLRGARRRPDGSRHRSHSARSSATDLLEPLETDVAASASARSGKKVLHVQRPPYHECVAFSATIHDYEEGHRHPQDAADRTLDLLHPDTRRSSPTCETWDASQELHWRRCPRALRPKL
eukprot:TRINITY_DN20549_c0_g2_i2.p1 TRINITY_DN20549_c0_g2~~TRINITY_DN20549_c0_g2_i2.p1  ORF type:complete len:1098 (+),score=190.41 TRINITY_DN20549_c0_g2_i2:482-3295(+)